MDQSAPETDGESSLRLESSTDRPATIGEFAVSLMRAHYWTMRASEPAVRQGDDPEDLHRMRVGIRRLRVALAIFEDALPARGPSLRERLGRVGSLLGAVRDLDVQLERMSRWAADAEAADRAAMDWLTARLEERRVRARLRAAKALESAAFHALLNRLEIFLADAAEARSRAARAAVARLAPELVAREQRQLVTLGDAIDSSSTPEALHAVRIRCKRLRYAVEFFESAFGMPARLYVERLVALQDQLGTHQDAVTATATLRAIARTERPRPEATTLLVAGALIERLREETQRSRSAFPRRYRRVVGARWRKLARGMEERRTAAKNTGHAGGDRMGVDLFVVRHAVAFERDPERWPDDAMRPLTSEGERSFRRATRALGRLTKPVGALIASPYERAWRTAEILHEAAGWPKPERFEPLEGDRHAEDALAALAARNNEARLAIVGHEPMLSLLCGILIGGRPPELRKGAVARLSVRAFEPGGATARWLLPPKVLRKLPR